MSKATVDRRAFGRALSVLAAVAPKNPNFPALQCVRVGVNGSVSLEATDLEVSARFELPHESDGGEFQALLPAARLAALARASKSERAVLEHDGNVARLDGAAVVGHPGDDFPAKLFEPGEFVASFDACPFADALRGALPCVSREVVRYALTGVLLDLREVGKGKKRTLKAALVASDGKRLACSRLDIVRYGRPIRAIIPAKSAELLLRIAEKAPEGAKVEVSADKAEDGPVSFRIGKAELRTRVVAGHFPDYEAVVPFFRDPAHYVVERKALADELARVALVCTDKTQAVKFILGQGKVGLFARTQDVGESRGEVLATKGSGELDIVFNPYYVGEFLKSRPKSVNDVAIEVQRKDQAGIFRGGNGQHWVIMPLTINL